MANRDVRKSVGFETSQVNPWNNLVTRMFDNLDDEDIEEILHFYEIDMDIDADDADGEDHCQSQSSKTKIFQRFCNALDMYDDKLKCAEDIQTVMRSRRIHTEDGESFADIIQSYIDELKEYREQLQIKENNVFLGRSKDVKLIVDTFLERMDLQYDTHRINGVCICGIGGQGKSALARQVCLELSKGPEQWRTYKVDLRNIRSTTDVVKSMLMEAGEDCGQYEDLTQLHNMLNTFILAANEPTLFCLDDCDLVIADQEFESFIQNVFKINQNKGNRYKVKLLLTTRQKFNAQSLATRQKSDKQKRSCTEPSGYTLKMENMLAELQLESLQEDDAVELLRKCSHKNDIREEVAFEIVTACACSPLAVTVVSELLHNNTYTPERLMFHLKMDERNVTNAMKVDTCIKQSIDNLEVELQKELVRLTVFQSKPFDEDSAKKVLSGRVNCQGVLQALHNCHLLEIDYVYSSRKNNKDSTCQFILHPLVFRYISEWKKPSAIKAEYNQATSEFVDLYEGIINSIVKAYDTKCKKGIKLLEQHKVHILQFYDTLLENSSVLKKYPEKTISNKYVLTKKRVSDLADLLLSDVKKRRLFQSEADRAKKAKNDTMHAFWMVEKADVFLMLHDKADIAMDILEELTNGKFAALRKLHDEPFYPSLVHALFHKVKGMARWKQRHHNEAIQHLQLSLRFYGRCNPEKSYATLTARVFSYLGRVYLDFGDLNKAKDAFGKGYRKVTEHLPPRKEGDSELTRELQWDIPMYWGYRGQIKLERARTEHRSVEREKSLNKALEYLEKGMRLDEELKMERLDGYCFKKKHRADVFAEQGLFDEALKDANETLDQRREILQPPHIYYTESVYQVARLYMLKGNEFKQKGDLDKAKNYWRTSKDYFGELEEHHLINGGISREHPMFEKIKKDHFDIVRLTGDHKALRKLTSFYKDIEDGVYNSKVASRKKAFLEMIWTPMEVIKNAFGKGGSSFGERDHMVQMFEEEAENQFQDMVQGATSGRKDSGMGHSSTELEDSMSSEGGSMSSRLERMRLEKSLSMEDNVFDESMEKAAINPAEKKKPDKKRRKTSASS